MNVFAVRFCLAKGHYPPKHDSDTHLSTDDQGYIDTPS
jgi:hypothetical protein